jgi:uncharacterized protein (DUF427 family)
MFQAVWQGKDTAWYYPHPSPAAAQIRDHVAFWHGVQVRRVSDGDGAVADGGISGRLRAMFGR